MQRGTKRFLAYAFDWIVLLCIAVAAALLTLVKPYKQPFGLVDLSISYPFGPDTISAGEAAAISVAAPALIMLLVIAIFVPGPSAKGISSGESWKRKGWELNAAWLGLATSEALAFMVSQLFKNAVGKPRPDLLARCNPDLANADNYRVGGYAGQIAQGISLYTWQICQNSNPASTGNTDFEDGFRSFPSGHSITAFAGLIYLTLFLASKFGVVIPYLAPRPYTEDSEAEYNYRHFSRHAPQTDGSQVQVTPARNQSAAPPVWGQILIWLPVFVAIYIGTTRFKDHKHHGFDIIFSSLLGILCGWYGYRLYHLPVNRSAGWAYGPRSAERAFAIGVGQAGYVVGGHHSSTNGVLSSQKSPTDSEQFMLRQQPDSTRHHPQHASSLPPPVSTQV